MAKPMSLVHGCIACRLESPEFRPPGGHFDFPYIAAMRAIAQKGFAACESNLCSKHRGMLHGPNGDACTPTPDNRAN